MTYNSHLIRKFRPTAKNLKIISTVSLKFLDFRCKPFREGDSGSVIYKMEEPDDSGKRKITIIGLMHAGGEGVARNRYYAIPLDAALRNLERENELEADVLQFQNSLSLTLLAMNNFI